MVKIKAPGACGELVQGTVLGKNFLITCPIDIFSEAEVFINRSGIHQAGNKTIDAVYKTFAYLGIAMDHFVVRVYSDLFYGKGMASSSADISAACQAAALSVNKNLTADEIADIALSVEPTDGIFYPGITLFDHVSGTIRRSLGPPPPMKIAIFDTGGEVDTVVFNRRHELNRLNAEKESQVKTAMNLVINGLEQGDCRLIGQGATLSALANQKILYKQDLETMIKVAERFGAVGINTAHSGTVMGVLFSTSNLEGLDDCVHEMHKCCENVKYVKTVNLISGGLRMTEGDIS